MLLTVERRAAKVACVAAVTLSVALAALAGSASAQVAARELADPAAAPSVVAPAPGAPSPSSAVSGPAAVEGTSVGADGPLEGDVKDAGAWPRAEPAAPPVASGASPGAAATERPAGGPEISVAPGMGLTVSAGERFSLNIKARIQIRYQMHSSRDDTTGRRDVESLASIGTARLNLSGNVYRPELRYLLQLALAERDFRDGATSPIFDAFLDWKIHRDFNLKAGQYFVPFDRLRTVREFALQMADRPVPIAELTLDRDVGVTCYSPNFLGTPLGWHVGAFGGGGTNQFASKDAGGLLVGRLELRPLGAIDDDSEGDLERRRAPALALGAGFAANWTTNRLRSTTGATLRGGTADYLHGAVDAVFKWRGLALAAEYVRRTAAVDVIVSTAEDGAARTEHTRSAHGWVGQASYVFDPPVEIVGRLSRLHAIGATDPQLVSEIQARAQEVAAGVNYYFNGHKLKLQADWIVRMPASFAFGRASHVVHLQLDATL